MKKLMLFAAVAAMAFGAKAEYSCGLDNAWVANAKGDESASDSVIQGGHYQAYIIQNAGADITAVANYVNGKTVAEIASEAKVTYSFSESGFFASYGQYKYEWADASQDERIDINPYQAYLVSFYGTPGETPTEFCVVANDPNCAEDGGLYFDDTDCATSGWQTYGSSPEPEAKISVTWSSDSRVEVNVLNKTTGSEVQNGDKVPVGSELEFTATAQGRWVYATEPEDWELDSNRTTITRTFTTEPQDLDVEIPLPTGFKIRYEWNKWDSEGQAVPPLTPNDLPEVFVKGTKITFDAKMVTDRRPDVEVVMITPEVLDDSNFSEYVHIYFCMREVEPEVTVDEVMDADLDVAAEFTVSEAGGKSYENWKAELFFVPEKDIPANTIKIALPGQSGLITLPDEAEADEHYPLLENLLGNPLPWGDLAKAGTFKFGIVNEGFTEEFSFRIELVIQNEEGENLMLADFEAEVPAKISVTWSSDSRVEVNVLNKTTGSEVQNGDKVPVGSELEFTATAQGRWVYATEPEDWELDSNRTTITRTFTTEPQDLDVEIPLPTGFKIRYEWIVWGSEGEVVPPLTPNDLPEVFVKGTTTTLDAKMVTDRRSDVEEVMITPEVLDDSNFLEYVRVYFRMREGEPVGEKAYIQVNDGKCTIFGEGEATELPNGFNRESIKSVTVTPGITKIGARFFKNCTNMKSVTLGKDVVDFGEKAFYKCFSLEVINVANEKALASLKDSVNYRLMYNASGKFIMAPKINIRGYEEWLQGKEKLMDATWTNIGPLIAQDLEKLKAANKYHFFRAVLKKQVD